MTTRGIKPGDAVLLIERRGEQQLAYNALVASFSMDEKLAGTHGEPAIKAVFVAQRGAMAWAQDDGVLKIPDVVHVSHRDFIEGRAGLGYEEIPPLRIVDILATLESLSFPPRREEQAAARVSERSVS